MSAGITFQTRYQLNSHLQSNTLELDNKAQTLSYEHYYPYGGTAIIAGKDKTQVGLVWGLGIVFTAFAEDVGADVQDNALLFCLVD
jgi:hypothetical protein